MKKFLIFKLIFVLTFSIFSNLYADNVYFMDFRKVLNESIAGKEAQDFLKKKYKNEGEKFKKVEKQLLDKERELVSKKKILSKEEYQKQLESLRKEVSKLRENKKKSLENIAKLRIEAKNKLLDALNPLLKVYLEDKKINVVIDKKEILYGNTKLEITSEVIEMLNKKVKSLNLK